MADLILGLRDRFQPIARFVQDEADRVAFAHGKRARISQGLRTFAQQNALYAKGRTAPGNIVTYVQGGYSKHNWGVAADIAVFTEDFAAYLPSDPLYITIGQHIDSLKIPGLIWGYHFAEMFKTDFRDLPHFEWMPGSEYGITATTVKLYGKDPFSLPLPATPHLPNNSPMNDIFTPSAEQAAAFSDMVGIGVYTAGTPKTQERYEQAIIYKRMFHAGDARWLRLDGANRAAER
jgi:hypothetical protein